MPATLKLDCDRKLGRKGAREWSWRIGSLLRRGGLRAKECEWTLTGKGHHVRIVLEGTHLPLEVLALQALLGSDPWREVSNLKRLKAGVKEWNVLFGSKASFASEHVRVTKERRSRALERTLERHLGI